MRCAREEELVGGHGVAKAVDVDLCASEQTRESGWTEVDVSLPSHPRRSQNLVLVLKKFEL